MKNLQKRITCIECATEILGRSDIDVVRSEMDHYRLYHPKLYSEMLNDVPLKKLFRWMLAQVRAGTPRTA